MVCGGLLPGLGDSVASSVLLELGDSGLVHGGLLRGLEDSGLVRGVWFSGAHDFPVRAVLVWIMETMGRADLAHDGLLAGQALGLGSGLEQL